jgi:hypothetical protein
MNNAAQAHPTFDVWWKDHQQEFTDQATAKSCASVAFKAGQQASQEHLREALGHYADEKNWLNMCEDYHKAKYVLTEWNSTIKGAWEGPNLAREALKQALPPEPAANAPPTTI